MSNYAGISRAVAARLLSEATITAIVGQRVRPDLLDQDEPYPGITFRMADAGYSPGITGSDELPSPQFEIVCWARDRDASVELADVVLAAIEDDGPDTWSPTCGPCMAMAKDFEEVAAQFEREEVRFCKVNTETHGYLAAPFKVRAVPTILFIHDGEIFICGRLKDLIIIRGRNVYPQDIEDSVRDVHPMLRPGAVAAFAIDAGEGEDAGERLVLAVEVRDEREAALEAPAIAAAVRNAIVERHAIPPWRIVVGTAGTVPKTSSGKVMRRACREAFLSGEMELSSRTLHVSCG